MIKLIKDGDYELIETKGEKKILVLTGIKSFVWIYTKEIGEILVASHKSHKVDHFLAIGKYRIYDVKDEQSLTDLTHLELSVGSGRWQGYLLLTGLPTNEKIRSRIIPTTEIITKTYV